MLQAPSWAGLSQSEHNAPAVYIPDPWSLVLRGRAPALQPLLDFEAAIALQPDEGHTSLLQQKHPQLLPLPESCWSSLCQATSKK